MNRPLFAPPTGRTDSVLAALDPVNDALERLIAALEQRHGPPGPAVDATSPHITGLGHTLLLMARALLVVLPCYRRAAARARPAAEVPAEHPTPTQASLWPPTAR